ncbi:unnamed protein product [uncultured bacterium]|nr:unnamed protein product [uncultured bacterium]
MAARIVLPDTQQTTAKPAPVRMEVVTDPVELEKARAQRQRFEKNWAWFAPRLRGLGEQHAGKCLCVARQELFVGDTPQEALALARAAHPDDDGLFTYLIPREKAVRIYAHQRLLAPVPG